MKKYCLYILLSLVLFSCHDVNTPTEPIEQDTTTYMVDTMNFMSAVAYTWDLHSLVTPYAFFVFNEQDTIMYELPEDAITISMDNCEPLYDMIFVDEYHSRNTPDTLSTTDVGVKCCAFSKVLKYPAYEPYRIDMFFGYTLTEADSKAVYYIGAWECELYRINEQEHWSGGRSAHGVEEITKDQVVEEYFGFRKILHFKGMDYWVTGSNSTTTLNYME